ncbi:MAG: ATP-binding protein [Chthoniobacter sp.]|nr:ATP-binding protein [Chthoniobacter sp.]
MNLEFKEQVWKAQFKATEESAAFEDKLRTAYGLAYRYEAARLLIGRSLAEPSRPDPLPRDTKFHSRAIPGENLFGADDDLWLCALILDGQFGVDATVDDLRALTEAHWARGYGLVREELDRCGANEIKLVQRLAEWLPETGATVEVGGMPASGVTGEIRLKVGSVSRTHPGDKPVDFVLNAPGIPPHIALMGAIGKGKTTTGVQIALELASQAGIPFLFIDPKGEFVADGRPIGPFAGLSNVGAMEAGTDPVPLDFLPRADAAPMKIARAAMRLRDTLVLCCKSPGDLQKDLLRTAIERVITDGDDRNLETVRETYEHELRAAGKENDSIVSRLNELTHLRCFDAKLQPAQFFSQSWVVSLKGLPEELKRLVTLVLLDAVSAFLLDQPDSPVAGGFRSFRHLLVLDEARKVLKERRSESLVDLVRQGRSKGSVVMLLSQDPSDFEGQTDDFTTQLGAVIAFACAQSQKGLGSLQGVFGRKLQASEFTDTYLTPGIAFVKLPGREPERIRCWQPGS